MEQSTAILVLLMGYVCPLLWVLFAPNGGAWRPPPGYGCPFGPRTGWLVIVLLSGIIGWVLFIRAHPIARNHHRKKDSA